VSRTDWNFSNKFGHLYIDRALLLAVNQTENFPYMLTAVGFRYRTTGEYLWRGQ
jgi:hypothetical protein